MTALSVNVPKSHGIAFQCEIRGVYAHTVKALFDRRIHRSSFYAAAEVAFYVGEKYGNADIGE